MGEQRRTERRILVTLPVTEGHKRRLAEAAEGAELLCERDMEKIRELIETVDGVIGNLPPELKEKQEPWLGTAKQRRHRRVYERGGAPGRYGSDKCHGSIRARHLRAHGGNGVKPSEKIPQISGKPEAASVEG